MCSSTSLCVFKLQFAPGHPGIKHEGCEVEEPVSAGAGGTNTVLVWK